MAAMGFYHPVDGYWVATDGVTDEILGAYPDGTIEVPLRPAPHYLWSAGAWVEGPLPVAPVPPSISFAQLLIGLVSEQWITEADGEGWLTGTLPAAVTTVIDTLPKEQQFAAKARALRPSEVLRADPLVAAMGAAAGKKEAEIDDFFRKYAGV